MSLRDKSSTDSPFTLEDARDLLKLGKEYEKANKVVDQAIAVRRAIESSIGPKLSRMSTFLRETCRAITTEEQDALNKVPKAVRKRCIDRLAKKNKHSSFLERDAKRLESYIRTLETTSRKRKEYNDIVSSAEHHTVNRVGGRFMYSTMPISSPFMSTEQYKEIFVDEKEDDGLSDKDSATKE